MNGSENRGFDPEGEGSSQNLLATARSDPSQFVQDGRPTEGLWANELALERATQGESVHRGVDAEGEGSREGCRDQEEGSADLESEDDVVKKCLEAVDENYDGEMWKISSEQGLPKFHRRLETDSDRVCQIIREQGLLPKLYRAAESGRLRLLTGQQGLTKLLHHAAYNGNKDLLKVVFKAGIESVDAQRELGCTALILACWKGHTEIVNLLLLEGADALICTIDGLSCLHIAAFSGYIQVVNLLLHGKADRTCWEEWNPAVPVLSFERRWELITKQSGIELFSALHMAANSTDDRDGGYQGTKIVASILEAMMTSVLKITGPVLNPRVAYGVKEEMWHDYLFQIRKELHCQGGEICGQEIVQNLMAYGKRGPGKALQRKLPGKYENLVRAFVDVILYTNAKDKIGRTALHHAAWEGRAELVRFLMWDSQLAGQQDPPVKDYWEERNEEHSLMGSVVNINVADVDGHTPLHLASRNDHRGVVEELLRGNVWTLWSYETLWCCTEKNWTVTDARFAKESYLQPNAKTSSANRSHELAVEIHRTLDKLTLERSILLPRPTMDDSTWLEDRVGITPLHYAVENEHTDVVELLIKHPKTDVFSQASDGQSPWAIAFPLMWKLSRQKRSKPKPFSPTQVSLRGDLRTRYNDVHWRDYDSNVESSFEATKKIHGKLHQQKLLKQAVVFAMAAEKEKDDHSLDSLRMLRVQMMRVFASFLQIDPIYSKKMAKIDFHIYGLETATLLHVAAYWGCEQEMEALLQLKTYKELVNSMEYITTMGQTALHFATDGSIGAMDLLLKEETLNFTNTNAKRMTPLGFIEYKIDWNFNSLASVQPGMILEDARRLLMTHPALVKILYRDRQVYVDASNAILVGAALIASVTFAGFTQPPLGFVMYYNIDFPYPAPPSTPESFAAVEQHKSVLVFWVFNALSFFAAIATVLSGAGAVLPSSNTSLEKEVLTVREWLKVTSALLALSILCVLGAFTAAGFASLPQIAKYQRNILTTATIGLVGCVAVLYAFCYRLYGTVRPSSRRLSVSEVTTFARKFLVKFFWMVPLVWAFTRLLWVRTVPQTVREDVELRFWEVQLKVQLKFQNVKEELQKFQKKFRRSSDSFRRTSSSSSSWSDE